MLLMRRKGQTAPFTLITLILLFGRKKTEQEENKNTAEPLNREPFPVPDIIKKTITSNDVSRSRDRLRLASLERDIRGTPSQRSTKQKQRDRSTIAKKTSSYNDTKQTSNE